MSNFHVIVPVFNGENEIPLFLEKIDHSIIKRMLFVDDGSLDNTGELLRNSGTKLLSHEKNKGKGAAIKTAMQCIHKNEIVITLDIDLQHPPEYISEFLIKSDRVINLGYRIDRKNMPVMRQLSNYITSLLISIRTGQVIRDSQCGYRSFDSSIFDRFVCNENGFQFESEFLIKAALSGHKVEHIPIPTIYGDQSSAMNYFKDTYKFIKMWFSSFFWV